jgi:N-acetylneuraminate synthase
MDGRELRIGSRRIAAGEPAFIVAELSANHSQDYGRAEELVHAAAEAGADAVKLQTYTPDTMTIDCDAEEFRIRGTIWEGRTLYDLYAEAYTPWDWQPGLKKEAEKLGLELFSTPFDPTAVDFLEEMGVPAYKVASFEIIDLPLIAKIAATGKPIIMSIGMATRDEIRQAVTTARSAGANEIALLRCTSAYPASPEEADLRTIPDLAESFSAVPGVSDHTLDIVVPITAVALGARIVEKHLTLSRGDSGPDSSFSLEPAEFKDMVEAIRTTEKALGMVRYGPREGELPSQVFRRSLFVVADIKRGEPFTPQNVRSIRPGHGLPPGSIVDVLGRGAAADITRGTPLTWDLVDLGTDPAR